MSSRISSDHTERDDHEFLNFPEIRDLIETANDQASITGLRESLNEALDQMPEDGWVDMRRYSLHAFDALEAKETDLITTQDLEAGEVVLRESAFSRVLKVDGRVDVPALTQLIIDIKDVQHLRELREDMAEALAEMGGDLEEQLWQTLDKGGILAAFNHREATLINQSFEAETAIALSENKVRRTRDLLLMGDLPLCDESGNIDFSLIEGLKALAEGVGNLASIQALRADIVNALNNENESVRTRYLAILNVRGVFPLLAERETHFRTLLQAQPAPVVSVREALTQIITPAVPDKAPVTWGNKPNRKKAPATGLTRRQDIHGKVAELNREVLPGVFKVIGGMEIYFYTSKAGKPMVKQVVNGGLGKEYALESHSGGVRTSMPLPLRTVLQGVNTQSFYDEVEAKAVMSIAPQDGASTDPLAGVSAHEEKTQTSAVNRAQDPAAESAA